MKYSLTGNTRKESFWPPLVRMVELLYRRDLPFCFSREIAEGLVERDLMTADVCNEHVPADGDRPADIIISFGGDGTMLTSAYDVGTSEIPILGVNIGRLGFLASVEVDDLEATLDALERGDYEVEPRMVLEGHIDGQISDGPRWALNEFVIDKSGSASMISIETVVDGEYLNTYWTDGLIFSTPTGSTAYSLSAGGPIMVPRSGVIAITPIAPHSLTIRPVVLADTAVIEARVSTRGQPYVFAADGRSEIIHTEGLTIQIRKAKHHVNLVKLPGHLYFKTLRTKLMWGQRKQE